VKIDSEDFGVGAYWAEWIIARRAALDEVASRALPVGRTTKMRIPMTFAEMTNFLFEDFRFGCLQEFLQLGGLVLPICKRGPISFKNVQLISSQVPRTESSKRHTGSCLSKLKPDFTPSTLTAETKGSPRGFLLTPHSARLTLRIPPRRLHTTSSTSLGFSN
tara:strand:- start:1688 stop:2173 length:486 start_codon:yes stop_codon:yes gene_type:complete